MFNVHRIVNEVMFPCNMNIILVKQPYYTWYSNYVSSWLVYIKSCSQHILTVLLCEEYRHHHHNIQPCHLLPKLCDCSVHHRSDCSPLIHKLKGNEFRPASAAISEIGCSRPDMWREERLTQPAAAGTRNKPINLFY